mmetsp:Transcript_26679/g.79602  ORF Transcript_26679/g.79602 Transcript_26679/m.79602 type:complete len:337 (-) Transcript_26679:685-1695(-)
MRGDCLCFTPPDEPDTIDRVEEGVGGVELHARRRRLVHAVRRARLEQALVVQVEDRVGGVFAGVKVSGTVHGVLARAFARGTREVKGLNEALVVAGALQQAAQLARRLLQPAAVAHPWVVRSRLDVPRLGLVLPREHVRVRVEAVGLAVGSDAIRVAKDDAALGVKGDLGRRAPKIEGAEVGRRLAAARAEDVLHRHPVEDALVLATDGEARAIDEGARPYGGFDDAPDGGLLRLRQHPHPRRGHRVHLGCRVGGFRDPAGCLSQQLVDVAFEAVRAACIGGDARVRGEELLVRLRLGCVLGDRPAARRGGPREQLGAGAARAAVEDDAPTVSRGG